MSIEVDDERLDLTAADLLDAARVEQIEQRIATANRRVEFRMSDVTAWPDEVRGVVVSTLRPAASTRGVYRVRRDRKSHRGLLEAWLTLNVDPQHIEHATRYRRALLEAAAVERPDELDAAVDLIQRRLRALGLSGRRADLLREARRSVAGENSTGPTHLAQQFVRRLRAERGVDSDKPVLLYFHGDFFEWAGTHWRRVADGDLATRVTAALQERPGQQVTRRLVDDVVVNLRGMAHLDAADQSPPLRIHSLAPTVADPARVSVFTNGVVDEDRLLDPDADDPELGVEVESHDPALFVMNCLPFAFDSVATCPLWVQTLAEIFPSLGPDDRRIEILQEFIGWCLLSDRRGFEKFLVLVGSGANGKSLVLRILVLLLGPDNVSHIPIDELSDDFRLFELAGKRANIASEMGHIPRVEEGRLKQLVSGESISANRKYRDPVTLHPRARLIFATNQLPNFSDRSSGLWRRLLVISFLRQFAPEEQDLRRFERLQEELPGIFRWAVAGARRLISQQQFTECPVVAQAVREHRLSSDSVAEFLSDYCEFARDAAVYSHLIYQAYQKHCERAGRDHVSAVTLGKALADRQVVRHRATHGDRLYYYDGVRLSTSGQSLIRMLRRTAPSLEERGIAAATPTSDVDPEFAPSDPSR